MFDFNTLIPALSCVRCGKSLDQIGGRRITAQQIRGIAVSNLPWTTLDRENLRYCDRLIKGKEIYLVIWWDDAFWKPEIVGRIKKSYLNGKRPWVCQGYGCGNRQCPECGYANNFPVASDLLYDDGRNPHLMIIPADMGCVNNRCSKFRDVGEGWEIVQGGRKRNS